MRKKILALLLGGVMAVSGLFLAVPVTVQAAAECSDPRNHFSSWTLTPGNGQITIQYVTDIPDLVTGIMSFSENHIDFYLAGEELPDAENKMAGDFSGESFEDGGYVWPGWGEGDNAGVCTIKGLTNGTTYYAYAQMYYLKKTDGTYNTAETAHTLLFLGTVTPDASLSNDPVGSPSDSSSAACDDVEEPDPGTSYEEDLAERITEAQPGAAIVMEKGVTTLSNSVMKELLKRKDVSLKLEFTYEGKDYVIIIPAGKAVDNDIPWYGPLYLAQHYGNRAGTNTSAASGTGAVYEVQSGDCLSKIAAANNMTLKQLLAKNPQIKDPDKIAVGQKINR